MIIIILKHHKVSYGPVYLHYGEIVLMIYVK
jgi:hypothetical protein